MLETAKEIAQIAPIATATIALGAAVFAGTVGVRQIGVARRNEAKRQFASYLDTVIVTSTEFYNKNDGLGANPVAGAYGRITNRSHVYSLVLAKGLMAFEEILEAFPGDKEWRATICNHLQSHVEALDQVELKAYSPKLVVLIHQVLRESRTNKNLEKAA
jgi:hypothetical protein